MAKKKLKEPTSYITPYLLYADVGKALAFLLLDLPITLEEK